MGHDLYRDQFTPAEFARFGERLRANLAALRTVLARPGFGEGEATLGAELELSVVDREGRACPINEAIRQAVGDPLLQLELDRFNLEYNFSRSGRWNRISRGCSRCWEPRPRSRLPGSYRSGFSPR